MNWWRPLKKSVQGVGSSIPPLQSDGGALVSDPTGKAALLSNFFDGKHSMDVVDCPISCHRRSKLCTFAFRLREVQLLLSELDLHGEGDPLGCFPMFFFRELASALAPKLSMVFLRLMRAELYPSQWCCADVVPIPK